MLSFMQYKYIDAIGQQEFNYQFLIDDVNSRNQYVLLIKELGE